MLIPARTSLVSLAVVATAITSLPAQQTSRFVHRPSLPSDVQPGTHLLDTVVLKFREGTGVRLRDGRFVATQREVDLSTVHDVLGERPVARYFERTEEDLDREREFILEHLAPGATMPAELNLYYRVTSNGERDSEQLIDRLSSVAGLEVVFAPHDPASLVLFDIPPTTPDYGARQGYQGLPPHGTNAAVAWRIGGGRGQGHMVAHVESDWRGVHEDIDNLATASRVGGFGTLAGGLEHGTACVSIMNAGFNGFGVRGYASGAGLVLGGIGNNTASTINLVAGQLGPGDVMSSSFGGFTLCGGFRLWSTPPEGLDQATFDAVQNATARGITYTFAAGNALPVFGSPANLDDPCWGGIWNLAVRDSGALLIAASNSATRTRASFSSFGSRIDANSWGENVVCADYGDLFNAGGDTRQSYTAQFGGTSAAAPIVAGVAAAYIGAVAEQNGVIPTPAQVRASLRAHGTPPADGSQIGLHPDLRRMLAAVGLPDGLELLREATVGGVLEADVTGPVGGSYALVASTGRGRAPIGLNRPVLLDTNTLISVTGGSLPSGITRFTSPVPADPSLKDTALFMQSLDWDGALNFHLSNSIEVLVVR